MDGKGFNKTYEFRNKEWLALCEKYEIRGQLNTTTTSFAEVHYRMFAKPKIAKHRGKRKKCNPTKYSNKSSHNSNATILPDSFPTSGKYKHIKRVGRYKQKNKKTEITKPKNITNNSNLNKTESILESDPNVDNNDIAGDNNIYYFFNVLPHENSRSDIRQIAVSESRNNTTFEEDWTNINKNKSIVAFKKDESIVLHKNIKELKKYSPTKLAKYNKINSSSDKENDAVVDQFSLEELMHFVEKDLGSVLKTMLNYRSVCKILESGNYAYWHDATKSEMRRLRQYITKKELKEYMRHCSTENSGNIDFNLISDKIVSKMNNNLRDLLIKREYARDNKEKYSRYCSKIILEWQRLMNDVPLEHIIAYASYVINFAKEQKSLLSISAGSEIKSKYMTDDQKEYADSGIVSV